MGECTAGPVYPRIYTFRYELFPRLHQCGCEPSVR
jgi:hypothetical protein